VKNRSSKTAGSWWTRALAIGCAGVLLLAGYAQAAHLCAIQPTPSQHGFTSVDGLSAPVPCLLCLSLHAPSLAAPAVFLLPVRSSSQAIVVPQPVFRSNMQSFALYVRPPPAA
jgi:hypothetical protein